MPVSPTFPGVYIEEIPSGVRTITGVATSITAFVGRALRGPLNTPVRVQGVADFERLFGGLWRESTLSYAVRHFFQHGGGDALIVRVFHGDPAAHTATVDLATATGVITLAARNPGAWGSRLRVRVNHETRNPADAMLFNLLLEEWRNETSDHPRDLVVRETFLNLSVDPNSARYYETVLEQESALALVDTAGPPDERPSPESGPVPADPALVPQGLRFDATGDDGDPLDDADLLGTPADRTGLYALEEADLFNLLCLPPADRETDLDPATLAEAAAYCQERRAFLLIDPEQGWQTVALAEAGVDTIRGAVGTDDGRNAALYFPRLRMPDPLNENRLDTFVPCGAVAGILARTDAQRGVWKAPAGQEASFSGVAALALRLTDAQNGILNPLGVNCLRTFPVTGHVVWGARTLVGADRLASEWKYVPVRRLALFLQESLFRGTQWAVFEPNDEPLWAQLRLNIGVFLHDLFRQGAFQGRTPRDAYFVKCDRETTTQADINRGVVNIRIGFAPLRPAEFVILQIQQMAGQLEA